MIRSNNDETFNGIISCYGNEASLSSQHARHHLRPVQPNSGHLCIDKPLFIVIFAAVNTELILLCCILLLLEYQFGMSFNF